MELSGERILTLPRETVWQGLMDPRVLQAAVPGAESVTDEGGGVYAAVVLASVGPVRARFKGRIIQRDLQAPERYALDFEGESGMAGFATGNAVVELFPHEGGTRLVWRAESQIGGRLAQIGARLIDATVARMSKQFFDRFEEVLTNPALLDAPAAAAETPATAPAPARIAAAGAAQATPGQVVVQMPAWAYALTAVLITALVGWIAAQ